SSPPVPQLLSVPPQPLFTESRSLPCAVAIDVLAFASGHGPGALLLTTLSLHFWSAFILAWANLALALAMARRQSRASARAVDGTDAATAHERTTKVTSRVIDFMAASRS